MSFSPSDYNGPPPGEVISPHIKCSKGHWNRDGVMMKTGPDGAQVTVLMPSASHGRILFGEGGESVVDKVLKLYSDGYPRFGDELPEGWSIVTMAYVVTDDDQLGTFTGPYGARRTMKHLYDQYLARGGRMLPVCTLNTRPRGDVNANIDPVFDIVAWKDAGLFREMFPGLIPPLQAQIEQSGVKRLQELPAKLAAMVEEANAPIRGKATIDSGRVWENPPPPTSYNGPNDDDDLDF
jgi:hypothetical protein